MTKRRRKTTDKRRRKPLSLQQLLELYSGPREPGSVPVHLEEMYPRWDHFADDEAARQAWDDWGEELAAEHPELFGEVPEWIEEADDGD